MCILSSNTKLSLLSSVTRIPIRKSLASTSIRNQQNEKNLLSPSLVPWVYRPWPDDTEGTKAEIPGG